MIMMMMMMMILIIITTTMIMMAIIIKIKIILIIIIKSHAFEFFIVLVVKRMSLVKMFMISNKLTQTYILQRRKKYMWRKEIIRSSIRMLRDCFR